MPLPLKLASGHIKNNKRKMLETPFIDLIRDSKSTTADIEAKITAEGTHEVDDNGNSALAIYVRARRHLINPNSTNAQYESSLISRFVELGGVEIINHSNKKGETPLSLAHLSHLEELLNCGASVDQAVNLSAAAKARIYEIRHPDRADILYGFRTPLPENQSGEESVELAGSYEYKP